MKDTLTKQFTGLTRHDRTTHTLHLLPGSCGKFRCALLQGDRGLEVGTLTNPNTSTGSILCNSIKYTSQYYCHVLILHHGMVVHDVCITLASYPERPGYEASIMHMSNSTYSPGQVVGVISKVTPGIGSGSNTIRWEISCRRKYCSNLGNTRTCIT